MTKISNHYICEKKGGGGKRGAQKNGLICFLAGNDVTSFNVTPI